MARADREHREQSAFFYWLELQYPRLYEHAYAVPNGGHRHRAVAGKLKAEGVKAGVLDICIDMPGNSHHGTRIEMKVAPNRPTPEQTAWIKRLSAAGYEVRVCYGFDEARQAILDIYGIPEHWRRWR